MGIEDGAALGLVMHGVTDRSQIRDRLAVYNKTRYNRASAMQLLSSFGIDQGSEQDVVQYLEGWPVPSKI